MTVFDVSPLFVKIGEVFFNYYTIIIVYMIGISNLYNIFACEKQSTYRLLFFTVITLS